MNDYLGFKSQALDFNVYSDGVSVSSVVQEYTLAPESNGQPLMSIKEGTAVIWSTKWESSPPPYTEYPTRTDGTEITTAGKNFYWERQVTYYSDNPNKSFPGAATKSTMLDVDFINALGITAKKITVLQNNAEAESAENRIIFEADGFDEAGTVKIGGFAVDQNSLHSGSNLKFAPGTTAAQITTIFKVYTDNKTGEDAHKKYLFGQQGGEIFSTSSLYNPAELPETIYGNILDSSLQKAAQSAPTILTEFTKDGLPFGQLLIYSKDIVADLDNDSTIETYNVWDKLYYNGGKWYSDTDKIWTNVVIQPNVYLGTDKIELVSGNNCFRAKDGEIFANAGTIGGFTIARLTGETNPNPADGLYSMSLPSASDGNKRNGVGIAASAYHGDPAFWAGFDGARPNTDGITIKDYEAKTPWEGSPLWPNHTAFYVTQEGELVTKNIQAKGGKIGNFTITNDGKLQYGTGVNAQLELWNQSLTTDNRIPQYNALIKSLRVRELIAADQTVTGGMKFLTFDSGINIEYHPEDFTTKSSITTLSLTELEELLCQGIILNHTELTTSDHGNKVCKIVAGTDSVTGNRWKNVYTINETGGINVLAGVATLDGTEEDNNVEDSTYNLLIDWTTNEAKTQSLLYVGNGTGNANTSASCSWMFIYTVNRV